MHLFGFNSYFYYFSTSVSVPSTYVYVRNWLANGENKVCVCEQSCVWKLDVGNYFDFTSPTSLPSSLAFLCHNKGFFIVWWITSRKQHLHVNHMQLAISLDCWLLFFFVEKMQLYAKLHWSCQDINTGPACLPVLSYFANQKT